MGRSCCPTAGSGSWSPRPNKEGALILPIGGADNGHAPLIEASADGSAISYATLSPLGADPLGNSAPFGLTQVLSTRGGSDWSSQDIATPHRAADEDEGESEYLFFSPDLSRAVVEPFGDTALSPEATETTPYVRDGGSGSYTPLLSTSDVPPGTAFGPFQSTKDAHVVAVTPDLSLVLFRSPFALTGNAVNEPPVGDNLYEWSGGRLQLVNVLPEGTASSGDAQLGGSADEGQDTRNALSSDGSRVFFTVGGALYVRDMLTGKTVQVPPQAGSQETRFQIASTDGSKVFYLGEKQNDEEGNLYVCQIVEEAGEPKCDVTGLSVDPNAGEAAGVQSEVVGAGEDGSVVYFVAHGKLAEGAEAGRENLYVESESGSSWSAPRLVAILSETDSSDWAATGGVMSRLTSRVSSSGRYLTFMSDRSLTGYDNRDAASGQPDTEVFLYDETTGQLRCVSCNPTGARPQGVFDPPPGPEALLVDPHHTWGSGRWLAASIPGWTEPEESGGYSAAYKSRVLSDEGRIFFDSADALVPQATNAKEDVYEYELAGVGGPNGCTTSARSYVASEGGCVSLVSSGTSSEESAFLDAGEGGGDVFFLTTAGLAPRDVDTAFDVYDAHVCSAGSPCVSEPVLPPPCSSGDACKAAPSLQPAIFGAPASATFSGSGNIAVLQPAGSTSTAKTDAQKKASHAKHKPKAKPKRRRGRGTRAKGGVIKRSRAHRGRSSGSRERSTGTREVSEER